MPKSARSTQSEYVISADVNIPPVAIDAEITGEGVFNFMQLKTISPSHTMLSDIQMNF